MKGKSALSALLGQRTVNHERQRAIGRHRDQHSDQEAGAEDPRNDPSSDTEPLAVTSMIAHSPAISNGNMNKLALPAMRCSGKWL